MSSLSDLDAQVAAYDLVISLVPYAHHEAVIRSVIKSKTNSRYHQSCLPKMRSLDGAVKKSGITILNEVGVDPGIDHLYAIKKLMKYTRKVERCAFFSSGAHVCHAILMLNVKTQVLEFYSFCGGLLAPERADNPLGFKFSWSPRGALFSAQFSVVPAAGRTNRYSFLGAHDHSQSVLYRERIFPRGVSQPKLRPIQSFTVFRKHILLCVCR